jgi:hypothetical protein
LEGIKMPLNMKSLVVSSVVFCATAAFAANQTKVNVPFDFTAGGQSYPAGSYEVGLSMNSSVVTMASKTDATKHFSWNVGPADAANAPAVIKFDQLGASYTLKTIQVGEHVTPILDKGVEPSVSATTSISGQ